jgi:type I restriction enzyme S subunit
MSEWKQTEIGIIPFDWKIQSSSIYCKKITDGTHDSPKSATSGYPLITSKHIKDSLIDFKEAYLVSEEDYQAIIKRSKVEQYDLIISMIGEYCGFTYLEMNQEVNYAIKNVGLFKNKSLTAAKWLKYYLDSPIGKHQLRLRRSGTSQPYISLGALRELPIITPSSEDERKKIVDILSCLDNKIDNLRRQNETLEKIAQTLFKHWFIDFEFPNNDGKPYKSSGGVMVTSELGDIPEGWRVEKMQNIIEVRDGTHDSPKQSDKGFKLITSKHLKKEGIDFDSAYFISENDYVEINKRSKVETFDILLSMIGTVGLLYFVQEKSINFAIKNIGLFKTSQNLNYSKYIYLFIKSNYGETYLKTRLAGTTQSYVTLGTLRDMPLIVPSSKILSQFKQIAKSIFDKDYFNKEQIQTLTKIRDTLLPKLMNGQIRVKD